MAGQPRNAFRKSRIPLTLYDPPPPPFPLFSDYTRLSILRMFEPSRRENTTLYYTRWGACARDTPIRSTLSHVIRIHLPGLGFRSSRGIWILEFNPLVNLILSWLCRYLSVPWLDIDRLAIRTVEKENLNFLLRFTFDNIEFNLLERLRTVYPSLVIFMYKYIKFTLVSRVSFEA